MTKKRKKPGPKPKPKPRIRPVTEEQQAVYGVLIKLHLQTGISPSLDEIADSLLISKTQVKRHIESLERHKMIERVGQASRGWQATALEHSPVGLLKKLAKGRVKRKGIDGDFEVIDIRLSPMLSKSLDLVVGDG